MPGCSSSAKRPNRTPRWIPALQAWAACRVGRVALTRVVVPFLEPAAMRAGALDSSWKASSLAMLRSSAARASSGGAMGTGCTNVAPGSGCAITTLLSSILSLGSAASAGGAMRDLEWSMSEAAASMASSSLLAGDGRRSLARDMTRCPTGGGAGARRETWHTWCPTRARAHPARPAATMPSMPPHPTCSTLDPVSLEQRRSAGWQWRSGEWCWQLQHPRILRKGWWR